MAIDLNKIWKESKNLPGTPKDFVKFLGVESVSKLENMGFVDLEQLSRVKNEYTLLSCGGKPTLLSETNKLGVLWQWSITKEGENWKFGENYFGRGEDHDEAALKGLLLFYEMVTLRRM